MVGQRLGQYLLRRQVGQGGMGAVYEALDERSNRVVALKVMRAEFTRNREALTRFFNEARAANLIEHPSVVQILEDGRLPDGTAYLAMEFLNGETLSVRMRRYQGPMPEVEARRIGWQLSGALAAAHRKSIVHRDLKPGNIMLVNEGAGLPERVKLLDFGIAKLDVQQLNLEDPMTRTGVIMGTPYYMSPEQCRGASNVGDRADVYSLGVITYQMLTGRLPFLSDGEGAVLAMHIYEPPQPPRALVPSITEGMQELVLAMLSKEPIGRPSMLHVHRRLEEMGAAYGMNQDLSMTFEEAPPTGKVPEPSTVLSGVLPTVNLHSNPPSQPSTLGQGTGQLDQPSDPVSHVVTRRPLLAGAALAGLMVLGAVGAIAFKLTRQIPVATAEKEGTAASAPTESTGHSEDPQAAGSTTPTATPPPVAETPKPAPAAGKPKPVASKGVKKLQRGKPQKGKKGAKKKAGKGKGKAVKGKPAKPSGPTKIVD